MTSSIVGKSKKSNDAKISISKTGIQILEILDSVNKSVAGHEERIESLEDTMRINGVQEKKIADAGKKSCVVALGGKESSAYQKYAHKLFANMWRQFKNYFDIPRYSELPAKDYERGLDFISTWQPDQEWKMRIKEANEQTELEV